jgi:hypothetical protein
MSVRPSFLPSFLPSVIALLSVIAGHSRSKNGVASLAYDRAIHAAAKLQSDSFGRSRKPRVSMDHRVKPGGGEERARLSQIQW